MFWVDEFVERLQKIWFGYEGGRWVWKGKASPKRGGGDGLKYQPLNVTCVMAIAICHDGFVGKCPSGASRAGRGGMDDVIASPAVAIAKIVKHSYALR
jgi:hypothetical protein